MTERKKYEFKKWMIKHENKVAIVGFIGLVSSVLIAVACLMGVL